MIAVGGFNSAIDKFADVDEMTAGAVIRMRNVRPLAGGKGLHVAAAWDPDLVALLPLVDVLLPNEVELQALTGHADPVEAVRHLANGHTLTIAKLGARGAMALVDDHAVLVAPPPVTPVDTTGAGDSFNAGFLHAWLDGQSVRASLRSGVACGALSTQGLGGVAAQPTSDALARCLEGAW